MSIRSRLTMYSKAQLHIVVIGIILMLCIVLNVAFVTNTVDTRSNNRLSNTILMAKSKVGQTYAEQQELARKLARYVQARDIERARKKGATSEEIRDALLNGSTGTIARSTMKTLAKNEGYQKFIGRGSLDQRLRAVVAYKRENLASAEEEGAMTAAEEEELEAMMEEDNDEEMSDEDFLEENEEIVYEQMVLNILEENKLNELKRNFVIDKAMAREEILEGGAGINEAVDGEQEAVEAPVKSSIKSLDDNLEMYTPNRTTWGVFPRPADISKTYGGGRAITKAEMDAIDDEYERAQKYNNNAQKVYVSAIAKMEDENEGKIKDALSRSRNLMAIGNRKAAVEALEKVQDFLSWQSDLGGNSWLELAMALETVERTDEARKIYGKLIAISWSPSIRRNALALVQGLDIAARISKQLPGTQKPAVDMASLYLISEGLRPGLTNEWDNYKKDDWGAKPWVDDSSKDNLKDISITTVKEAYNLLTRLLNPLKLDKVPSEAMSRAFRKMYYSPDNEKVQLLKSLGLMKPKEVKKPGFIPRYGEPVDDEPFLPGLRGTVEKMTVATEAKDSVPNPTKVTTDIDLSRTTAVGNRNIALLNSYGTSVNGTWDLVASLFDSSPYTASRFESGALRRVMDVSNGRCTETVPVLWGLSTAKHWCDLKWNEDRAEILLSGGLLPSSNAPWIKKKQKSQYFQVIYCDEVMMISREVNRDYISGPDLYSIWKRVSATIWKKYT